MTRTRAAVAAALLIGGCASDDGASSSTLTEPIDSTLSEPTTTPDITVVLASTTTTPVAVVSAPADSGRPEGFDTALYGDVDAGLAPFVERATSDLAARLGVEKSAITVVSATLVTWPDSAMGCPLPDLQYAPALQDGSLIELAASSTIYRYHSGGERVPFLCDARLAVPPVDGGTADS